MTTSFLPRPFLAHGLSPRGRAGAIHRHLSENRRRLASQVATGEEFRGTSLILLGRADEKVKVSGESVDLARLNRIWEGILAERGVPLAGCLLALPDVRLGHVVSLVYEEAQERQVLTAMDSFNEHVMPFERIRAQRRVEHLPRSPMGKILRSNLVREIGKEMGA